MTARSPTRNGIKDIFYETRVLMGREYTLRRFATEVLGGTIDPVMLGYIEKGKRFPSEALVRRLAALRKQDAHELLALLWRDRLIYAFGRELRRVLQAPRAVDGVEDAELAVVVSQAIAALDDDGSWMTLTAWRKAFRRAGRGKRAVAVPEPLAMQAETALLERGLVERKGSKVRRKGRHFTPQNTAERRALALEYCALFVKGLLDKLALPEQDTGTYLRNHFLNIAPARLPEFQKRLDDALRGLAEEFADDAKPENPLLNVLVTSTPF
ncbi:MAG: hypothetical protein SF182_18310 [Deltaproteobacteria bacterium]|nr:hypothetical protein [Deltaproteobacteria bacterium]